MTDETLYSALHWAKKAEYWAGQAAQGQIQADWAQTDNTKKDFIKNKPGINDLLPSQTGNIGKFLKTDGTSSSWSTVDALPAQTGQSGKFLTTDGSAASWGFIPSDSTKANVSLDNLDSTGQAVIDGKVNLNLNNMNPSATSKDLISGWSFPDGSNYSNLTLPSSGSEYTAPANGFLILDKRAGSAGGYVKLLSGGMNTGSNLGYGASVECIAILQMRKGDKATVTYTATGDTVIYRFVYAHNS